MRGARARFGVITGSGAIVDVGAGVGVDVGVCVGCSSSGVRARESCGFLTFHGVRGGWGKGEVYFIRGFECACIF
jgi:hypothetical protein